MDQEARSCDMDLTIPASQTYAPVAALALSALGMIAGLDVDLLCDVRTVVNECMDCLVHQAGKPERIAIRAGLHENRLWIRFFACDRHRVQPGDSLELDITRGILETLMPEVSLESDEDGVHGIECSMPV